MLLLFACTGPPKDDTGTAPESLTAAEGHLYGDGAAMAGTSVAAGDLDGDGVDELVVGALGAEAVCAWTGPLTGEAALSAGACGTAPSAYDYVGSSVAVGPGVLVGLPGADGEVEGAGAAILAASLGGTLTGETLLGEAAGDGFGTTVAFAGDLDGDGSEVLAVGAPGSDRGGADAGAVWLFGAVTGVIEGGSGSPGGAKHAGAVTGDAVGSALCDGADLDGDGVVDLAVGAPGWDADAEDGGAVAVWYGPLDAVNRRFAEADVLRLGDVAGAWLGGALDCGGDTDGDGYGEVLAGADAWGGGRAVLWGGAALAELATIDGEDGAQLGYSVAFAGGGVAVGAPSADDGTADAGLVAWFAAPSGALGSDDADAAWTGVGAGDLAGTALAGVTNADGSGSPGLLVGAPYARDPNPVGGGAWLLVLP